KWTLQECIDYAVENNIALRQSRNAHLAGLEDTYQAKAAMFPSLNASASQGITNRP
ncbi:MAG TPA: transporter, partial [Rikenellaceae bacterium]|nr:transporter [Rikenellaceae bacterium]